MSSIERITSASLFAQMSSLAYERNDEFRRGAQDSFELSISNKLSTGETALDDLGNVIPLFNTKTVHFEAERTDVPIRRQKVPLPTAFDISCTDQSYIDALPPVLLPLLDDEVRSEYDICNPGDLQQIQGVAYRIENSGGSIDIARNITYSLHGPYGPLYEVTEIDESADSIQWVPVAHEQKTLRIERRVTVEQADDRIDQLTYDATFDAFRDDMNRAGFYDELSVLREQEATVCISALLRCLTHGKRIPRFSEMIDTE